MSSFSDESSTSNDPPGAPPNTRAPSPTPGIEGRLPYAEPIPNEFTTAAAPWIEVIHKQYLYQSLIGDCIPVIVLLIQHY